MLIAGNWIPRTQPIEQSLMYLLTTYIMNIHVVIQIQPNNTLVPCRAFQRSVPARIKTTKSGIATNFVRDSRDSTCCNELKVPFFVICKINVGGFRISIVRSWSRGKSPNLKPEDR